ncbi:hypothetical protein XENTR_v10003643 [Xenopus tropicalis]|nr:hypothetical protein XENTR_v10003643 [Xenopus tropicalis]
MKTNCKLSQKLRCSWFPNNTISQKTYTTISQRGLSSALNNESMICDIRRWSVAHSVPTLPPESCYIPRTCHASPLPELFH